MEKQRDTFVDVAKGIAMLLVVRIHTEVFGSIHAPYPIIAVPLFFFLSGFYDNTDKPLKVWLPKAFRSLFLTGIIWALITIFYSSLLNYLKDRTINLGRLYGMLWTGGGVMWFLFALFWAKCGMWIVGKSRLPVWIALPLLLVWAVLVPRINLPLLLDEGIAALPFYYLGHVLYPWISKRQGGGLLLALIGMGCILLMPMSWFPWFLVPYSADHPMLLYPLCFTMTVLSFFPVLWIGNRLSEWKWLSAYGTQTLGILVLHPLMLHTCAVALNRLFVPGSVVWVAVFLMAYVLVCILSYYFSVWIGKHFPILLGRKG